MPHYSYKAIDPSGAAIEGVLEASDRKQVVQRLFARNFKPVSISLSASEAAGSVEETVDFFKSARSAETAGSLSGFYSKRKLAQSFLSKLLELFRSGMPLGDSVKLLSQRLNDPRQKALANTIWKDLSEGRTLAASMADLPAIFDPSTSYLIEAGEASGNLVPVLERLVEHMEQAAELRTRILNSLAYPAVICLVALVVVLFFLFFLYPTIENTLSDLGGEPQFLAKVLMTGSDLTIRAGPFLIAGLIIALLALLQWRRTRKGRERTDYWLLRIPFIGRVSLYSEILQTASLMAVLMESGINTTETLRLAERTLRNTQMRNKFRICRRKVQEGASLASTFRQTHFFPDLATDILTVGENTGNIVNSLWEITKANRRDLTQSLRILTALISTAALIFAFALVTIIALSLVLSILQITDSIRM